MKGKERNPGGFCAASIRKAREFFQEAREAGDRETALQQMGWVGPGTEVEQDRLQALRQRVINRLYPEEPKA